MTVLVLAGSGEARRLCAELAARGVDARASLAGETRAPEQLGLPTRIGGFGGAAGFAEFVQDAGVSAVVDATHPFASQMTATAAGVCADLSVPHLVLQRPGWQAVPGDRWHWVEDLAQAPRLIPQDATVFLGTGRKSLDDLAGLAGRRVLARVIDPPTRPFPFAGGRFVLGKPPFSVAEEVAFFRAEGIDWLVVKNAGGAASYSKLEAARALGLPVVIQRRPALPPGVAVVETVDAALDWVAAL